jgi:hypothetical protein
MRWLERALHNGLLRTHMFLLRRSSLPHPLSVDAVSTGKFEHLPYCGFRDIIGSSAYGCVVFFLTARVAGFSLSPPLVLSNARASFALNGYWRTDC